MLQLISLLMVAKLLSVSPHTVRAWVKRVVYARQESADGFSLIRPTSKSSSGLQELTRHLERAKRTRVILLKRARFRMRSTDPPIHRFLSVVVHPRPLCQETLHSLRNIHYVLPPIRNDVIVEVRAMGSNHDAFAGWLVRDERRLLTRDEVLALLNLSNEKVDQLINTRQITAIRIAGEERFDSRDIDQLIESYKSTASRRPS